METECDIIDHYIDKFKHKQLSHPNISKMWLFYLFLLKKRNYDEKIIKQCSYVLNLIENGQGDLKHKDIVSLLLYKSVIL